MFPGFKSPTDMPWTMSYVVKKRRQVSSFNEMQKEKRPPDKIIWWGTEDDLDEWLDKVYNRKGQKPDEGGLSFIIPEEPTD
jgi:hypothetical protein